MTVEQKKAGVGFHMTVVLVVAGLLYPLSFGPACFLCEKNILSQQAAWVMFRPMTWLARRGPWPASSLIVAYAEFCGDERRLVDVFQNEGENAGVARISYVGERRRYNSVSPIDYEFARETE